MFLGWSVAVRLATHSSIGWPWSHRSPGSKTLSLSNSLKSWESWGTSWSLLDSASGIVALSPGLWSNLKGGREGGTRCPTTRQALQLFRGRAGRQRGIECEGTGREGFLWGFGELKRRSGLIEAACSKSHSCSGPYLAKCHWLGSTAL